MRCNHAIFCRISIVLVLFLFLVSGMHALDVANYITEATTAFFGHLNRMADRSLFWELFISVRENPTRSMSL